MRRIISHHAAQNGGSHAVGTLLVFVVGSLLSKYVWELTPPLAEAARLLMTTTRSLTTIPLPVNDQMAGTVVVMIGLSFIWGVGYQLKRHS